MLKINKGVEENRSRINLKLGNRYMVFVLFQNKEGLISFRDFFTIANF